MADKANISSEGYSDREIIYRLLKLSWKYKRGCFKAIFIQVLVLSFTLGGLNLAGVGIDFIKKQIDPAAKDPQWLFGLAPPSDFSALKVLFFISILGLLLAGLRYLLDYVYRISIVKFLQKGIVVDLRAKVYEKMQSLSFRFFDARTSGTLINRVTSDVQSVRLFIDGVIIQGTIIFISIVIYFSYMIFINFSLTTACMITIPLMVLYSRYFSKKIKPEYVKNRALMDNLVLNTVERVQGMHVVKGFVREEQELTRLGNENRAVRDQKQQIFNLLAVFNPLISMLTQLNILILLSYGGYLVIKGELMLGSGLIVFLGLLTKFSQQVNKMTMIVDNIQQSIAAAGRVFEVLDTPVEIRSPKKPVKIERVKGRVTFKNVSFEYVPGEKVLDNICFDISPGQFVGILGSTGAGKSTLTGLIPRFYDVSMGAVKIDGYDVRKFAVDNLRRQVGIVFQESFLFSNTVAANIAFGCPGANMDDIKKAAKLASAHDFIMEMPEGYDSIIGEAGNDLSGGQRQRLAIARSILLDPPILLFDDPTASVDSQTEKEIFQGIDTAMQGRTTFLVTHRIGVLKGTDFILVMHKGRIIQMGSHDELIKEEGHYRKTADIQMDGVISDDEFDEEKSSF